MNNKRKLINVTYELRVRKILRLENNGGILLILYLVRYDQSENEHFFVSLEKNV